MKLLFEAKSEPVMGIGHNTKVFSTVKIIEWYTSNYWLPERGQKKGGGQRKRRTKRV